MLQEKKELQVEGATVPFYEYKLQETHYIEFDTSKCAPPEPMVNAMLALDFIKDANTKVVMINHKSPLGLLGKIGKDFEIEDSALDDGCVRLVFSYKQGASEGADLSSNSCAG